MAGVAGVVGVEEAESRDEQRPDHRKSSDSTMGHYMVSTRDFIKRT